MWPTEPIYRIWKVMLHNSSKVKVLQIEVLQTQTTRGTRVRFVWSSQDRHIYIVEFLKRTVSVFMQLNWAGHGPWDLYWGHLPSPQHILWSSPSNLVCLSDYQELHHTCIQQTKLVGKPKKPLSPISRTTGHTQCSECDPIKERNYTHHLNVSFPTSSTAINHKNVTDVIISSAILY